MTILFPVCRYDTRHVPYCYQVRMGWYGWVDIAETLRRGIHLVANGMRLAAEALRRTIREMAAEQAEPLRSGP